MFKKVSVDSIMADFKQKLIALLELERQKDEEAAQYAMLCGEAKRERDRAAMVANTLASLLGEER